MYPVKYLNKKSLAEVQDINFNAPLFLMTNLFKKKKIKRKSSIVFVSSISSNFPYKGGAAYTSFKAALETYSKVLALEFADKEIRSNCIKAGLVDTPVLEETIKNMPKEVFEKHKSSYPLGFGTTNDVANAVVFLLSDASKWITGTNIVMDGGLTAGA